MNLNQIYENKILVGIATITATIILLGWIAINENARMEEFTERAEGRSIEQGALLYEANCAPCHGFEGLGTTRAPALNNPHLFGYDYRGDLPNQINALTVSIERATDPEEKARLEAEKAQLEAEQLVIEETVLYDWSEMTAPVDLEVCADTNGEVDGVLGYSERQMCEMGQVGVELMLFDQRISQRLEGAYEDAQLLEFVGGREQDQLEGLFETRAELLSLETLTPEQQAELAAVRADIGEIMGPILSTILGNMETQLLAPLQTEEADLDAREELTAEEEERLAAVQTEIEEVEALIKPLETVTDARNDLLNRQSRYNALRDAHEEVKRLRLELAEAEGELAELPAAPEDGSPDADATRREELTTTATEAQAALETAITARAEAHAALVSANDIKDYRFIFDDDDTPNHTRLAQVSWTGSLEDFVEGTLVGGRPPSKGYWPEPMPAWSQRSGASLRDDQIKNLVLYILNWDREFTIQDLRNVDQFAKVPTEGSTAAAAGQDVIGSDVEVASTAYNTLLEGGFEPDLDRGEELFTQLACAGCHIAAGGGTGPSMRGLYDRVTDNEENRLTDTGYESAPDQYIIESIVQPQAFIVPGFQPVMLAGFGERITTEDFGHLMAYLKDQ